MKISLFLKILFVVCPLFLFFCLGFFWDEGAVQSVRERRLLAQKPDSFWFNSSQTESYLADHLPFRDSFLDFYFEMGMGFDLKTPAALIGKEKWLFQREFANGYNLHNIQSYQNKPLLTPAEILKIRDNLHLIHAWCRAHNIRLYVLFPPSKDRVYARYMPSYILRENRPSLVKEVIEALPPDIPVIPLEDELILLSDQLKEPLYYLTESHWSEEGAFQVYRLLMQRLKQDFKTLKPVSESDFDLTRTHLVFSPYIPSKEELLTRGNLYLTGMKGYDKPIYRRYRFKKEAAVQRYRDRQFRSSDFPLGNPQRVYIIGDSYGTYMHAFLSATFIHVQAYRFNENGLPNWGIHFTQRQEEMLADQTNILILEVSDLKLKDLLRIF